MNKEIIGELEIIDIYKIDKQAACQKIFNTKDPRHPGVNNFLNKKEYFIGGNIKLLKLKKLPHNIDYLSPIKTKNFFADKKWKTIAGFQTRNIPHKAHEYLLRTSLEHIEGLFVQPLVGSKKKGDFTNKAIFDCYRHLIKNFLPKNRVFLGPLYSSMWYAGPREAIFHSIIRRNYGCTHFIVGRDHAGFGKYYGKYDAHKLISNFENELGINIMKVAGPYYCKICEGIYTENSCMHYNKKDKIIEISGSDIRRKLKSNKYISKKVMRPEIINVLNNTADIFI